MEIRNAPILPIAAGLFAVYTFIYLVYQLVSLPVNFTGRSFDLAAHDALVSSWRPERYPVVDIYLPICREPIPVLRNTWIGVSELIGAYPGSAEAFVLDDGTTTTLSVWPGRSASPTSGGRCTSTRRRGTSTTRSPAPSGEHIVVFDADFRPRADFLAETLPYLDDPAIGIVQTPQFFRVSQRQTWVERAAGATLEVFYRAVQVSRDRFGSALCVGSNAVYRRAALTPNGRVHGDPLRRGLPHRPGRAPARLPAHLRARAARGRDLPGQPRRVHAPAVPVVLRRDLPGVDPAYVVACRCRGGLGCRTLPAGCGTSPPALRTLILPLIPITLLAFLPGEIQLRNALLLVPAVITGTVLYPLWHNVPYTPRIWPLSLAVGWAQVLALWDYSRGKVMSWQPTRGPGDATRRFWRGVALWNGTLALVWLALAAWRIEQTGSVRFAIVAVFGVTQRAHRRPTDLPGKEGRHDRTAAAAPAPGPSAAHRRRWSVIGACVAALAADHRARRREGRADRPAVACAAAPSGSSAVSHVVITLPAHPASYLGAFAKGVPESYGPIQSFAASHRRATEHRALLQRLVREVPVRIRHPGNRQRCRAVHPDRAEGSQPRRDRRRRVRHLPAGLRHRVASYGARTRPRRHHRLRPRDERLLVPVGLPAHVPGGVRGRLAAHRHCVPAAGRRRRDLAVDGQHHRPGPRASRPRRPGGPATRM